MLTKSLIKSVNELVEIKIFDVRRSSSWYNSELRTLKIQRDISHQKAIFTDEDDDWKIYRRNRNIYGQNGQRFVNSTKNRTNL
jgi:hypothetical protein